MIVYRALLLLYPASFRAEYGAEMRAIFARRYQHARAAARAGLLLEALADVLRNAPAIHADILRQDFRSAIRTLMRTPALSATVMLVSALGIGATTAAFSLADHVFIKPLPFREPERLVKLWQDQSYRGFSRMELSPGNYRDWKAQATSFAGMAAYSEYSANLIGGGDPARLDGCHVTGDLFAVLGVPPLLGRLLAPEDDQETAGQTVVISERLWRERFGSRADVVGTTLTLNDVPRVVIGVMPRSFEFPGRAVDFWTPFQFPPDAYADRSDTYLRAVARLNAGVSIEGARSEMRLIAQRLEQVDPKVNARTSATVIRLRDEISQQSRLLLWGVVAASVALLLIACTNLANLLLTRALARQRELAVRAALGAGRHRLIRQMLTESILLAAVGGAAGIALAIAGVPFVARLVPTTLPIAEMPSPDVRMLASAAVATLVTAIGVGLIPALRSGRHPDASALREGARAGTGRRTERLRSALVVAEVTASVVLLVSVGLLVRAMWKVQDIDPGFTSRGVLTLRTALPLPKYNAVEVRQRFYEGVLSEVRALPGVANAAYITGLPMVVRGLIWPVTTDGRPGDPAAKSTASVRFVTPGFFDTLDIPIRAGRDVSSADTGTSPFVAVVSESFVREHWPDQDPIGRQFFVALRDRIVVGVVGDIRVRGLERVSEPQVYLPSRQVADGSLIGYTPKDLVIESSVGPASLVPAIRQVIGRADPQQPISEVRPLIDIVEDETGPRRVQVRVLGAFAAIAFLLSGLGLHGLLAFNVSQRAREIGVRIALGAERRAILGMVMWHGLGLAAVGLVLGSVLAFAAGRTMQALLAGVSPLDLVTFAGAVALSLTMTIVGSLLPALRAVRVDPITVIRTE
ncbi:MAG: ABC transporter permease [Acidobacteria bacterium]|nr:ABC transporter permease [Acidobacteriota bacterium]